MTNDYELLRNKLVSELVSKGIDPDTINAVLNVTDETTNEFHIEHTGTSIIPNKMRWRNVLKTYIASCKIEGHSDGSLKNRFYIISKFFNGAMMDIDEIQTNTIRAFLYSLQEITDRTRESYRTILSAFFGWSVANGYIQSDPSDIIKPIRYESNPRCFLNDDEVVMLRKACHTEKERCIIEILLTTGCRVSEIASMLISDIDMVNRSIQLMHCKGKKNRKVFFSAVAYDAIKSYLSVRASDDPHLFVSDSNNNRGKQINPEAIRRIVEDIADRTDIVKEVTPHVLRHTFATNAVRSGQMTLPQLQKFLGHTNPQTTMIYAEILDNDIENAYRKVAI